MLYIDFTLLQHCITLLSVYPFTDSFRYSISTLAIHFYFTRSKMCLIFHLQLHMEFFETAPSLRQCQNLSRTATNRPKPSVLHYLLQENQLRASAGYGAYLL